jgi:hypothetical protein
MTEAKGKFCGDFPPPKTPFTSQPFFGRYTTSGGGKGNPTEGGDEDSTLEPSSPSVPTPAAPEDDAPEDTGGAEPDSGDDKGFDPEKYEAPPQAPPGNGGGNGDGNGGGTQAPG